MTTLIRPIAGADALQASLITVAAFNDSEALTAFANGSSKLELIGWHTAAADLAVTRAASKTGDPVSGVVLTLMGRTAVTAVCSADQRLVLATWSVPSGLSSIDWLHDSGSDGPHATVIAMTALTDTLLVTAMRAQNGNLFLICWRLESNNTLTRLGDAEAGTVDDIAIAAIDGGNVLTAVRNGSQNLELIGWSVGTDGVIEQWSGGAEAGTIGGTTLTPITGSASSNMLTAVNDGANNLLLIAWQADSSSQIIRRVTDSGGEAGTPGVWAVTSTVTASGALTILVSLQRGSGNLGIIGFELLDLGGGDAIISRTGDYSSPFNVDQNVGDTSLVSLEPGRILGGFENGGNLQLSTYAVSDIGTTFIRPVATATAEPASVIAVQAFSESETLTAFIDGSGNLKLIGWNTAAETFMVTQAGNTFAGAVSEVALALMGRIAVTAVCSGGGKLLLISWSASTGLTDINRLADTGSNGPHATEVAITALTDTLMVTAFRAHNGNLFLICWQLDPTTGNISQLGDAEAGEVSFKTFLRIAAIDEGNVVTAVCNGNGNLELIGWSVGADGVIERWTGQNDGDSGNQAGAVTEIALMPIANDSTCNVLTSVSDGSGDLLLIAWQATASSGTIERVTDSSAAAGAASGLAITSTVTAAGTPTVLAALRRGIGNLGIIAFELIDQGSGSDLIVRTGDYSNRADADVNDIALAPLASGRIVSAILMDGTLRVTTYNVLDATTTPAPAGILALQYQNPDLSITNDDGWASSFGGRTFPLDKDNEWTQVLAPTEDYDDSPVGCAGWIVAPDDSGGDLPVSHPFGFDWEFGIVVDDDANGYTRLLSLASVVDQEGDYSEDPFALAAALGLSVTGLLGLECEIGLIPNSFRARINHGDRVAVVGRWVLDDGHDFDGNYRTEIHPPLLLAAGSVQQQPGAFDFTRVLFMSRPYLSAQRYTQDLADAYFDSVPDDGPFLEHLIREVTRVVDGSSDRIEMHPKIKSFPFRGMHQATFSVRPPPAPAGGSYQLAVSFQFTIRNGVTIAVTSPSDDTIEVQITLDDRQYAPPELPDRVERSYSRDQLDALSSGAGIRILGLDVAAGVAALLGTLANVARVAYILHKGVKTDEYDRLAEVDILNADNAVIDAFADNIPAGMGVVPNGDQPYPIYGWLEAKWMPIGSGKPALTTANLNAWLASVLADPARAKKLKDNWRELMVAEFDATKEQMNSLTIGPGKHADELDDALARVVNGGGTIHVERASEHGPGRLIVSPKAGGSETADLSIGIYHCTFDANCRNWHCGWGPSR